ncbi:MFS transporter [Streptomyces sp. NPDC046197]|uniref:MFS transporter n=1 Tax=Streptomyces sp. NPDC046197 TaxID=3154337 RepID=UPI0033FF2F79
MAASPLSNDPSAPPGGLRKLLLAQTASQFGFRLMTLTLPILAVTELHASPFQVSLVAAGQTAAFLLLGLPAGALVDRVRKRPVMVFCDLGRCLVLAGLPVAWAAGVLSVGYLCGAALAVGVLTVFFDIADQSYLPHVVGREQLVPANAKLASIEQVSGVAGPGVGGLVIQLATAPLAVIGTAFGYLWSAVWLLRIHDREPRPARRPGARLHRDIAAGMRYVVQDRLLRPIVLCSTTMTLCWSIAYAMLLVLLAKNLAVPAGTIGLLLTAGGAGGVLASAAAGPLIRRLGDGTVVRLSVLVAAPFTLLAALTGPGWRLCLVAVANFAFAAGVVLYNVAQVSFRQRSVPPELLSRVNATVRFFAWGARPIGSLCGGTAAELIGVRGAVWIGAAGTSLACLWLYLSPLRTLRDLPLRLPTAEPEPQSSAA